MNRSGKEYAQYLLSKYTIHLNSNVERCDTTDGPCACGAWHDPEEIIQRVHEQAAAQNVDITTL